MERFEEFIGSARAADQFCRSLTDLYVGTELTYIDDDKGVKSAYLMRLYDGFSMIDMRNMFACNYDRQAQHIKRDGSDAVYIHFNTGMTPFYASQFGRDYVLNEGMAGLYVNSSPIQMQTSSGNNIMGFDIPRAMTARWREVPEDIAVSSRDPHHPALQMLRTYARFMLDTSIDAETAAAMHIHMAELAGLWLCGLKPKDWRDETAHARQAARYQAIRNRIRRDFTRPDLSAFAISQALGLSERTVQQVLTQQGTSFSRLLGDARAEKACDMLSDPAHRDTPVITIAFACGFNDLSTFYRAFKARYDEAPGAFRSG